MVSAVVIEFGGMRCQPLRRALCVFLESFHSSALIIQT
ncbi:TPA: acetyltransferase [Vibrio cholerae]|nr:acetyltransferase [Vibrio cholerae]EMC8699511.1 acetyltransferase [Vibrio cholerae]HCF7742946.1 acetyltransferase [Vibrio cholerae]HCF7752696.1 acetyltransferase [Vibrio cholerae]HCF7755907.1 acetyltransferase [Vibrio cholerae]